jgi:hypothetical protein
MPDMRKSIAPTLRCVSLLCFATLAQGYTNFDTKCSTPENLANFVSSLGGHWIFSGAVLS